MYHKATCCEIRDARCDGLGNPAGRPISIARFEIHVRGATPRSSPLQQNPSAVEFSRGVVNLSEPAGIGPKQRLQGPLAADTS